MIKNNNNQLEIEKEKEKMKELTKIVFSFTKLENQTINNTNLLNENNNFKGMVVKTKNLDFLEILKKYEKKFNFFKNKDSIQIYSKLYKKQTENEKEKLLKNLGKIIFFSYRKNLPLFKNSHNKKYTSDSGWGCMIRCGQMIMSKAIYKYYKAFKIKTLEAIIETLEFFIDSPFDINNMPDFFIPMMNKFYKENYDVNDENKKLDIKIIYPPFCIKTICFVGELFGKNVGDWFSDVNMVNIFKLISNNFNFFPYLEIFTFQSNIIYSDIFDSCFELIDDNYNNNNNNDNNNNDNNNIINNNDNNNNNNNNININNININNNNIIESKTKNSNYIYDPNSKDIIEFEGKKYKFKKQGLIFVSQKLGLETISPEYYETFKELFNCKYNLGIIGGIKRKAFYFIGLNSKGELIYLDPHTTKSIITSLEEEKLFSNYLVKEINHLNIKKISCAFTIGFLFRNMKEFKELKIWMDDYFNKHQKLSCISIIKDRKKMEINYEKMKNAINMESDDF
jgi:hypothetical protein